MKKTKVFSCLLAAALIAASFAGCGNTSSAETEVIDQNQLQQSNQDQRGTMAKVVSMEGNTITVVLADKPERRSDGGTPPTGGGITTDSAAQTDGKTPPSPPTDGDKAGTPPDGQGTPPDGQDGKTPPTAASDGSIQQGQPGGHGQGGGQFQFTGEEVTYTLSADVKVTKGTGDSTTDIDLSDLAADDVIRFATTADADGNEVITSIQVIE